MASALTLSEDGDSKWHILNRANWNLTTDGNFEIFSAAETIGAWTVFSIQPNWRVGIGVASPTQKLQVSGSALATAWNTTSDERKKENIQTLVWSLDNISQIRWVRFDWKEGSKKDIWVIAQEVERVYPEFVTTDGEWFKSVDYSKLVSPLIEAVKELKERNIELERKLEMQNTELNERMNALEWK